MTDRTTQDAGNLKAAPDLPDYPHDWDSKRRLAAYWYALMQGWMPSTTGGWHTVETRRRNHAQRRNQHTIEVG